MLKKVPVRQKWGRQRKISRQMEHCVHKLYNEGCGGMGRMEEMNNKAREVDSVKIVKDQVRFAKK